MLARQGEFAACAGATAYDTGQADLRCGSLEGQLQLIATDFVDS
jgi:hypothetical protein